MDCERWSLGVWDETSTVCNATRHSCESTRWSLHFGLMSGTHATTLWEVERSVQIMCMYSRVVKAFYYNPAIWKLHLMLQSTKTQLQYDKYCLYTIQGQPVVWRVKPLLIQFSQECYRVASHCMLSWPRLTYDHQCHWIESSWIWKNKIKWIEIEKVAMSHLTPSKNLLKIQRYLVSSSKKKRCSR